MTRLIIKCRSLPDYDRNSQSLKISTSRSDVEIDLTKYSLVTVVYQGKTRFFSRSCNHYFSKPEMYDWYLPGDWPFDSYARLSYQKLNVFMMYIDTIY
jgi:hypothetical protein